MKIKQEDFDILLATARQVKTNNPQCTPAGYKQNNIGKDTEMRFRWDLYWSIRKMLPIKTLDNLRLLNDSHIDTALKKIVKELY